MDLNLAERCFLITGGTDGLGLALAEGSGGGRRGQ